MNKTRAITVALGALAVAAVALSWKPIAAWYRFHSLFESIGANEQGLEEYRHRKSGIVMVRIPGGSFLMGSPYDEAQSRQDERPRHRVILSPFLIAKCEVRQVAWVTIMGGNPSTNRGHALPVEGVSWEDCQTFCERTGLSLPTEAQWEYACRAGTTGPFYHGETITTDQVNHDGRESHSPTVQDRYRARTVPVGSFPPNAWGLHDFHGNASEWCLDVYDDYCFPATVERDPVVLKGSRERVARGGSWFSYGTACRSAYRISDDPGKRTPYRGFRPAYYPLP